MGEGGKWKGRGGGSLRVVGSEDGRGIVLHPPDIRFTIVVHSRDVDI